MDDLLHQVMQGVDPSAPGAFWVVFGRLVRLVPWLQLTLWSVFFVLVGAGLGWCKGRTREGVVWALLLGPVGWLVVLWPRRKPARTPPPLPPAGGGA